MTAAALTHNVPLLSSPFDAGGTNSIIPTPTQMASGWIPNIDNIAAEQQNYLHNTTTAALWLQQQLGLALPFNPVAGASVVATPKGGIVSLKDSISGDTQFYVALTARPIGYTDPSLDPTNWAYINFPVLAKFTDPYADATGTPDAILASYSMPYPALQDGMRLELGLVTTNATTTPTLAPTLNGNLQTARVIWKFVGVTVVPLAPGDLQSVSTVVYDLPNTRWILLNPTSAGVQPGTFIIHSGTTAPVGALVCPTAQTNLSRTTYAALHAVMAASGYPWGSGDGSTTFGMPWFPADYSLLQASANVGTQSAGVVQPHIHTLTTALAGAGAAAAWVATTGPAAPTSGVTTPTGNNLAAGVRVLICVKY